MEAEEDNNVEELSCPKCNQRATLALVHVITSVNQSASSSSKLRLLCEKKVARLGTDGRWQHESPSKEKLALLRLNTDWHQ